MKPAINMGYGLYQIRTLRRKYQRHVAADIGCSHQAYGQIERQTKVLKRNLVEKIAESLNVKPGVIVLFGVMLEDIPEEYRKEFQELRHKMVK